MKKQQEKRIILRQEDIKARLVSWKAQILYGYITALSIKKGYCYATNKFFAKEMGVCRKTITRSLNELKSAGMITTRYVRDENGNRVRAICPALNTIVSYGTGQNSGLGRDSPVLGNVSKDNKKDIPIGGKYSDWD